MMDSNMVNTSDQQSTPQHFVVTISAESSRSTHQGPPLFVGASPMFPPETVPPDLNHPRVVPPGHFPIGQIPFLFPPPGTFSVYIMASLVLPNVTLGIPIWYINPTASAPLDQLIPCHALTLVQSVPMTLATALVPSQPQQEPAPIAKASIQGGKAKRK